MGTFQTIFYRLGLGAGLNSFSNRRVTLRDAGKCRQCSLCVRACPMQLSPNQPDFPDDIDCIRCAACINSCPPGLLALE
ncbi:MAG: 4Fe-4S dicluster domain-containing protein [Bacillota bacterium]